MSRLLTKEQRQKAQKAQIDSKIQSGYILEVYKGLKLLTTTKDNLFLLQVFADDKAHHELYLRYRTEAEMRAKAEQMKKNYDIRAERKASQPKYKSSSALCATAIREELKKEFQGFKFSVTCSNYSNGNSVDISWTDGPTTAQVEEFTNKYQYGHFNGMEDIYEHSNSREDIPQAKYVQTSRSRSNEADEIIKAKFVKEYGAEFEAQFAEYEFSNRIYREFSQTSFFTPAPKEEPTARPTAPSAQGQTGNISVIEYSEKAVAIVGEGTKKIKDELKKIGAKFNFRLSCGAGWIYPKSRINELTTLLSSLSQQQTAQEDNTKGEPIEAETEAQAPQMLLIEAPKQQEETPILATPQTNVFILESFKIIWHEGRHIEGAIFTDTTFYNWEDVQKAFVKLWEVNEKGQGGGYTKVKCEMKFKGSEIIIDRIDITDKIKNGDFNPSDEHIVAYLQSIADETEETPAEVPQHPALERAHPLNILDPQSTQYKEALKEYEQPKMHENLKDIKNAVERGEVISLCNLSNIVNNRTTSPNAKFSQAGHLTLFSNAE